MKLIRSHVLLEVENAPEEKRNRFSITGSDMARLAWGLWGCLKRSEAGLYLLSAASPWQPTRKEGTRHYTQENKFCHKPESFWDWFFSWVSSKKCNLTETVLSDLGTQRIQPHHSGAWKLGNTSWSTKLVKLFEFSYRKLR